MKRILRNKVNILVGTSYIFMFTWLVTQYEFVINHSESLPLRFVIIKKGALPKTVDQVFVFRVKDNPTYKNQEVKFIKLLGGKESDEIIIKDDRAVYVNEKLIGVAKTTSLKGLPLEILPAGKIPPHKFFAYGTHKDSYDSRYKEIGLIDEKDIIGTAVFVY